MSSPPRKTALITGASAGIGKATALHLARQGYHVLATSRQMARLDGLMDQAGSASLPISGYELNINEPASVEEVIPRILDEVGGWMPLSITPDTASGGIWKTSPRRR